MTWPQAKRAALADPDRFDPGEPKRCECCRDIVPEREFHAHHIFYHRMKRKPELNVVENMQLVCGNCHHTGDANNYKNNQRSHWDYLCGVYGAAHMVAWNENLPLISKEYFG